MSWFTVGEIIIWLALAATLGVLLGWLLHEIWNRARRANTAQSVPAAPAVHATIKGNHRSMIYHVPGSPLYERTQTDIWFTSEDEAQRAGYRKPKNQ